MRPKSFMNYIYCTHTFYNMIRNHLFTAIALAMAFLLMSSCAYEELSVPDSMQDRIVAAVNTPTTKTAIGGSEDGQNVVGILWTSGDQIGVFDASGAAQKCYAKTNDSGYKADAAFAVAGSTAFSQPAYAYYPYDAGNDGKKITELTGTLPCEQMMDNIELYGDYKYGRAVESTDQGHKFVFSHLFSMACIEVDATNTPLAGQKLKSLSITVKRGSDSVNIAGDFIFNATNGVWTMADDLFNSIVLNWTDGPVLSTDPFTCYASLFPTIRPDDEFTIKVATDSYSAVFTAKSRINFYRESIYTFPVTLRKYESIKIYDAKGNEVDYKSMLPVINRFEFKVADNEGKLLDNELKWNSSKHTPSFSSMSSYSAKVDDDIQEISLTIPYLYDFKLIPSFSVNANCKVTVNGVEQVTGKTEVDFSKPVTYTVTNTQSKYTRDYVVKVTNSGLPVVVIKHSKTGDFSKKTTGGFLGIGATTLNQFVDFYIRGKDTDWVEDDQIIVYNSDGTVDCEAVGGVRLRGNTSQVYPKKPFAIKLTKKKSLLGMPEHKRWVLLANWLDHSMIRNAVAFDIAHVIEYAWQTSGGAIGNGIPWNVHGQHVELVVVDKDGDAHHVGNYYLCEQIKIDENRLNITSPDGANTGTDYTQYGHLFEVDGNYDETSKFKTSKQVPFMFKDEVSSTILNAVKTKVQKIETNIYKNTTEGFEAAFNELDINSVIDQMLIFELAMNREYGDPRSVYMYMDKDGKLSGGPVWDFDRGTFQNPTKAEALCDNDGPKGSSGKYYRVKSYNEWLYWRDGTNQETDSYSYVWYRGLAKSAAFQAKVQERWAVLKQYLDMIPGIINQYGEELAVSFEYDSKMWPVEKADIRKYKDDFNDWSGDEQIGDWGDVIANFIEVYNQRLAGMDALITNGTFTKQ